MEKELKKEFIQNNYKRLENLIITPEDIRKKQRLAEIERLDRHIERLSILRLTCSDSGKIFYDNLITLQINRKLELQQEILLRNSRRRLKPFIIVGELVKIENLKLKE